MGETSAGRLPHRSAPMAGRSWARSRPWPSLHRVFLLVVLNDRFGIGRHHLGRFHPGFDFVLQLS
jgi:hypothetical protein